MTDREAFNNWWNDFTSIHEDWKYADSEALRFQAWQAAKATGPAWHDKPTAPGLWVVGSRCLHINELDLPIYGRSNCRWYGPIPADDGGKP